jgi:hypothetical protein
MRPGRQVGAFSKFPPTKRLLEEAIGIGVAALTFAGTLAATALAWHPGYHPAL